jgi:hypothetical protein
VLDSGDVETAIPHATENFGTQANSQLIFLCHPAEAEEIASFRAGEENNNGQTAKYSFIPSAGAPAYLTEDNIVGQIAPAEYKTGVGSTWKPCASPGSPPKRAPPSSPSSPRPW